LEDGRGQVVIFGSEEYEATDAEHLFSLISQENSKRPTLTTVDNDTSSLSRATYQILLRVRESKRRRGKLTLIDLAGSERGADTNGHDWQHQTVSSEINKSVFI
jgi:kinesin family protein 2/24